MVLLSHISLVRTWAITRKEFIHIVRDPFSLGMAIGLPVMMLVLFGFALTLDVDNVPLVVWDQDNSPASRTFTKRFSSSRYFSLRKKVDSYRDVERALDTREALVALVIPRDFTRKIESNRQAAVQLIADGSDANTATIAIGYAEGVVRAYSADLLLDVMKRGGVALRPPLDVRQRVWFNADLKSRNFIIPGLICVILMVIAALLTSLTVALEWERGTMEQLISTPVKGPELIVGKLIPYFVVGMLDMVLAVLMAEFVFEVPMRDSVALLFAVASVFLIGTLSMGILISVSFKNQMLASQVAILATFLPAFLLSGFMFSLINSPKAVQVLSYVVPARYFVTLIRAIYLKGVGLAALWPDVLFLCVFAAVFFTWANVKFKKKLA